MPEIFLDLSQIDSRFQQMGGKTVPQGVNCCVLVDAAFLECGTQGILDIAKGNRLIGRSAMNSSSAASRENPDGIAVRFPDLAKRKESRFSQRNVAVPSSFSVVDVNHHASAVNVTDLKVRPLLKAKSASVDRL